ncbi:hypothetical protein BC829DRAFT_495079 [Chytridium lagenaria]|nr:hypothetical protein BC829DRAFT_495079 [Chytridium lagenaria]
MNARSTEKRPWQAERRLAVDRRRRRWKDPSRTQIPWTTALPSHNSRCWYCTGDATALKKPEWATDVPFAGGAPEATLGASNQDIAIVYDI